MALLAGADALSSLSGHRRLHVWEATALQAMPRLLRGTPIEEDALDLAPAAEGEEVVNDYAAIGLTLRSHPLALLRRHLDRRRLLTAADLQAMPNGRLVRYAGIVTLRQAPETAKGTIFVSLEDETGTVQIIVRRALRERQRAALLRSRLMGVFGTWQRDGGAASLIAGRLVDLSPLLGRLITESRDFR